MDNKKYGTIKNEADIELRLCGKDYKIESNCVEAKKIDVFILQEESCGFVLCGEKIKYTFKVCNKSDVKLFNLKFKDCLESDLDFIPGSFTVDGKKEHAQCDQHIVTYTIPELCAFEEKLVTFECLVDCKFN